MEDEKPKVKTERDLISSNLHCSKKTIQDPEGHCRKHCLYAKKRKNQMTTTDLDDILLDLPEMEPTMTTDTTSPATATESKKDRDIPAIEKQTET